MGAIRVVINADDFGRSAGINAAVIEAHRSGILTSTSLMVTGEAADEAVALAKANPSLAVGLHLVLAGGSPASTPERIPHLLDKRGRFPDRPIGPGFKYFFSPHVRKELALEIEAQLQSFAATGLALSHVDGHMHLHMHPTIFKLLAPLAVKYGAGGIRIPRDELRLSISYMKGRGGKLALWSIAFGMLSLLSRRRLRDSLLNTAEHVYGVFQTGRMRPDYILHVLDRAHSSSVEMYFHPSMEDIGDTLGPNPGDLDTLLDPGVRRALSEKGWSLSTYPELGEG